jgi:hypothetical protein
MDEGFDTQKRNLVVAFSEFGVREAVERIRTGDLTAEALAEALLTRCAAAAPLNAFISLEPDRVLAAARRADKHRHLVTVTPTRTFTPARSAAPSRISF